MNEKTPPQETRIPSSRTHGGRRRWLPRWRGKRSEQEARALALPPMSRGTQAVAVILVFGLGVALTVLVLGNPLGLSFLPPSNLEAAGPAASPAAAAEPEQLHQCPMHPEVIDNRPSDCPICGMKLVAVSGPASADAGADGVIRIDPVQVQNIGVVSEPALRGEIARTVRTVGVLDFNADRITWINTKFSGWIEKVHVNYVGQEVRRDEPLFEIYSPELVTTQEEYLRALDYRASLEGSERGETLRQAESLLRSTRDRLAYWDISEDQIRSLEGRGNVQRRLTVRSPVDGVVTEVMEEALEGMFVRPGMNVYKIADLSSLWAHADIYESDLPWVREGQPVTVSFRFDPDRSFRGAILFLYPEVSRETRTLKICVEVPNEQKRLRAGMYADVVIHGPPLRHAILIPNAAVLRSGERELVFVDLGHGRFEPREVELGIRGEGDVVQVLTGLDAGESVVTQAQFMLDSESRMQEAIAKFAERGTAAAREAAGHVHGE
jgi:Cu(I)/Ag(I) efflux system membrane fusion protein/cobalt-zinc-cadmium efflux system membrane fusion protein